MDDPKYMGEHIAQQIPGVPILQMLRQGGEQMPGLMQRVMQLLGMGQQGGIQGGQQYQLWDQLPRHGGIGPDGKPIIIPGSR